MILLLTQTFNILASVLQQVLQLTSFVGQVIVLIITTVLNVVFEILKTGTIFLQIVYEDNISLFTEEIPNCLLLYFDTVYAQYSNIKVFLCLVYNEITFKIISLVSSISSTIDILISILFEILFLLKRSVLILGEALWIILSFLPLHLPDLLTILVNYIKGLVVHISLHIYRNVLKITNFLSDVPFESFIGILSAIAIVRFYVSFQLQIHSTFCNLYWMIVHKVWYLYHTIYNYFVNTDVGVITRIASRETAMTRDIPQGDVDEINPADALCVICQERQKCVLILPCKHVCLCSVCCLRLYGYQRTCPICRTFIYHSVTIYM